MPLLAFYYYYFLFKISARKCFQSPAPPSPTKSPLPDFLLFSSPPHTLPPAISLTLTFTRSREITTMNNNRLHQPHVSPSAADYSSLEFNVRPLKRRGSYNCGRCGLPKKGHSCHVSTPTPAATATPPTGTASTPSAAGTPTPADSPALIPAATSHSASRPPSHQHYSHLRRALSFENIDFAFDSPGPELVTEEFVDPDSEVSGGLPAGALWEVLRRLPPAGILAAAKVCKGWRETARRLWKAAEELRLRVPLRAQVGVVGNVLQKCPGLVRLSLRMER